MSPMPPMPNWSSIHPLLTHFPIPLLLLSPVPLLLGAVMDGKRSKRLMVATLLMLCVGAGLMYPAILTGADAAAGGQYTQDAKGVLEEHQMMARRSTSALTIAAILFALTLAVRTFLGLEDNRMIATILPLAFLLFYLIGLFGLFSTMQHGAQIVHGHAFRESKVAGSTEVAE